MIIYFAGNGRQLENLDILTKKTGILISYADMVGIKTNNGSKRWKNIKKIKNENK